MGWLRAGMLVVATAAFGIDGMAADTVPGRYLWPLDGQVQVSSGFCDWRLRHYHGGIDISTGGREGLDVRAADSGWVMRVSTSYWGYGKAVYLQMNDGRVAVYGHLSEFAPAIQKYVDQAQYSTRRYQQNLFPAPGELPFARGDIIAQTGQTGGGPPHLHFEIRTGNNRPLNPLVVAFDKPDVVVPTIKAVTIVPRPPLGPNDPPVSVNGGLIPVTILLEGPAANRRLTQTPVVTGAVGLSILASDGIDGDKYDVSPYRLRALVNDRLIGRVEYDSINYAHTQLIDLERLVDPRPGADSRPVNLFRREHNVLWYYSDMADEGWLIPGETLIPGANVVRIEAEDVAGNIGTAEFGLMLATTPPIPEPGSAREAPTEITFRPSEGGLVVMMPRAPGGTERRFCRDSACQVPLPTVPVAGGIAAWLSAGEGTETIWVSGGGDAPTARTLPWTAVRRDEGGTLTCTNGEATVTIRPDDLYSHTYMRLSAEPVPKSSLQPVSPLYELAPFDAAFARDVRLAITLTATDIDPTKVGVYRHRNAGRGWVFEGADRSQGGGVIMTAISRPGAFALLPDTIPPTIRRVQPGRGVVTTERRPAIRFEMFDDLSGIGSDEDVGVTIDDQWVPVEYDPEQGVAKASPRWDLPPGEHRVEIVVRDRMGNEESFLRILNIK